MTEEKPVNIKDVNGDYAMIDTEVLFQALVGDKVRLFGMDFNAIREFQVQYQNRGGLLPITKESIALVYNRD